jgi:hypothetical protein
MASNDEYQQIRSFESKTWICAKLAQAENEYREQLEDSYFNPISYRDYKSEDAEREGNLKTK